MKTMKLLSSLVAVCITILLLYHCTGKTGNPVLTDQQMVQRGEYLVTTIGCGDCHSPKLTGPMGSEIIPERMLSGYPADRPLEKIDVNVLQKGWVLFTSDLTGAVGPWGVSFAANLTSDQSGVGNWTEDNFLRAMKQGKFKGIEGSRDLLPPMPWANYAKMSDEDVRYVFAYLKTVKPVYNLVPAAIPPTEIK